MSARSIHSLPLLATAGNRIVRGDTGEAVRLRGVNLSGMEYSAPRDKSFLESARVSRAEITRLTRELGCNILRVPFNQKWVLDGCGDYPAEEYLEALDRIIQWALEGGAYTLLDLHWLDAETVRGGDRNRVAPLPDRRSPAAWTTLALRYRACSSVLYDLFNEPHNRLSDDPLPLTRPGGEPYLLRFRRRVHPGNWKPWAATLIRAIRQVHPLSLIFVSGTNWGYDLRGMRLPFANLVYATHVYPGKRPDWRKAFGEFSRTSPVFVAEWGGEAGDLDWGADLLAYMDERELGWTAWSWRDWPHLQQAGELTPFGHLVARSLGAGKRAVAAAV